MDQTGSGGGLAGTGKRLIGMLVAAEPFLAVPPMGCSGCWHHKWGSRVGDPGYRRRAEIPDAIAIWPMAPLHGVFSSSRIAGPRQYPLEYPPRTRTGPGVKVVASKRRCATRQQVLGEMRRFALVPAVAIV